MQISTIRRKGFNPISAFFVKHRYRTAELVMTMPMIDALLFSSKIYLVTTKILLI